FPVASGTLSVVLSNNADNYVIADAMRVVAATGPAPLAEVFDGTQAVPNHGSDSLNALVGIVTTHTFTVTNGGTASLTLSDPITLPAGFTLAADFGTTTLAPGASTTFTVLVNTGNAATYSGTVTFGTSDANNNPFSFTLTT